jgi:hypothetical protein
MSKKIYTPMESILVNWVKALTPKATAETSKKEGERNG